MRACIHASMAGQVSVTVYCDPEMADAMEKIADEKDLSVSATWRQAAGDYMFKHLEEEYNKEDGGE